MNKIDKLRKEIDLVDSEIVRQLNKRIKLVREIGECKKEGNLPVEDLSREEKVLSNLEFDGLDEGFLRDIYKTIFSYSKLQQKK